MNIKVLDMFNENYTDIISGMHDLTLTINDTYPGHSNWFWNKFVPGISNGERKAVYIEENNKILGVSFLKDTEDEKKICTLFVDENERGKGIASKLLEKSFETLGTDKPVMTVSSRNIEMLNKIVKKYGFELTHKIDGAYQGQHTEYYFNSTDKNVYGI